MPKCKICGVNALFLKVNEDGICKSCAKKVAKGIIVLPNPQKDIAAVNKVDLDQEDEILLMAIECVIESGQASTSLLQRKLNLSYTCSAHLIDQVEARRIVGPFDGSKPRKVFISRQQWIELKMSTDGLLAGIQNLLDIPESPIEPEITTQDFDRMDGLEFEQFCAQLLRDNGFREVEVTRGSGDFGIDVLAKKMGVTFAIQCKCYQSKVGNSAVQEASSGRDYYNRMVGVVMTNNYFTPQAIETAERTQVLLWDRSEIQKMIELAAGDKQ